MQMQQLRMLLSLITVFALAHGLARADHPKPADRGLSLQDWVAVLSDTEQPVRYRKEALEVIERRPAELEPFVDQLIRLLEDDDYWFSVERLLAQIGPPAVEPLAELLDHDSPIMRAAAASTLERIGAEGKAAIPRLVQLLDDEATYTDRMVHRSVQVNSNAARALAAMGLESLPALKKAIFHQSAAVRRGAAQALGLIGKDAMVAVDDIVAMCGDSDADVALSAVFALSRVTRDEQNITPALLRALRHSNDTVRSYANHYLGKHVRIDLNAIAALVDSLKTDKSADVRGTAAEALGTVRSSPSVVRALTEAVDDSEKYYVTIGCIGFESSVDTAVTQALINLGSPARPAIPKLLKLLKTEVEADGLRGRQILKAIAAIGKAGDEAVPMLETLLLTKHWSVDAAKTLVEIDSGHAAAHKILRQADETRRQKLSQLEGIDQLCQALAWIRDHPRDQLAIDILVKGLRNIEMRVNVALALADINGREIEVAPVLFDGLRVSLEDHSATSRQIELARALLKVRNTSETRDLLFEVWRDRYGDEFDEVIVAMRQPALPVLIKLLDEDVHVRLKSMRVLQRFGPEAKQSVPALIECLKHYDYEMRTAAAKTLGEIGPAAKAAEVALIRALQDRRLYVRVEAAKAIPLVNPDIESAITALQTSERSEFIELRNVAAAGIRTLSLKSRNKPDRE